MDDRQPDPAPGRWQGAIRLAQSLTSRSGWMGLEGLSVVLLLLLATAGCRTRATEQARRAIETAAPVRLVLTVEPIVGQAPLTVHLNAELVGQIEDTASFRCPSLAWIMGNGAVLITRAQGCREGYVPHTFSSDYTYTAAGSYDASVRLLALDLPPSNPVQVLVRGATPTPAPVAAVPGPTILVASALPPATPTATGPPGLRPNTPPPATRLAQVRPTVSPAVPTPAVPLRPTATPPPRRLRIPTRGAPAAFPTRLPGSPAASPSPAPIEVTSTAAAVVVSPRATAAILRITPTASPVVERVASPPPVTAPPRPALTATRLLTPPSLPAPSATVPVPTPPPAQVLPADLYYLAGRPRRLWRLPASGSAPEPLTASAEKVADYAVSPTGIAAYVSGGALRLVVPLAEPLVIQPAGASAPVWSREGRRLAFAVAGEGVVVYELLGGRRRTLAPAGKPLAWSRDATWLLIQGAGQILEAVHVPSGARTALPVGPAARGGWLGDRDVAWLADPGLRLVTLGDTLLLTTVMQDAAVEAVFARPDLKLLVLVSTEEGLLPQVVDLAGPAPVVELLGPPLPPAVGADFAWAPDGRHGALAGPEGLVLVDPVTGARIPLVAGPAAQPQWVLSPRRPES